MKPISLRSLVTATFLVVVPSAVAQTTVIDDFDDGEWESKWVIQHNNVGATSVAEGDSEVRMMNTGANQNGGIASIASFSPFDQGVRVTFVLNGLADPITGEFSRPSANGLFMGVVANNGAFYRAANNFGLAFFGQESRTASGDGFGLVAGDRNGGAPSDFFFDDRDVDPDSLADGCTATISASEAGWSYEITGLLDVNLNEMTFSNSGAWADAPLPCRPGVAPPQKSAVDAPQPPGGGPGLQLSLGDLLEHVHVQDQLGHQLLEPAVLLFQLLEPFHRCRFRPSVFLAPSMVSRHADLQLPANLLDVRPTAQLLAGHV